MADQDRAKIPPGVGMLRGTFEREREEIRQRTPERLWTAHEHSSQHRREVLTSENCGCSYCEETFTPSEIGEWIDEDQTAMCPRCGIDSVIGSASGISLTPEFLHEMHQHWFS
jgi:hypothetical protein